MARTASFLLLFACLHVPVGGLSTQDTSYYPVDVVSPGNSHPHFYKDGYNLLLDIQKFDEIYIQFHGCVWSPYGIGNEAYVNQGDDRDNNNNNNNYGDNYAYWYLNQAVQLRANVAFSVYGILSSDSTFGLLPCSRRFFINSFYTAYGAETFIQALELAGVWENNNNDDADQQLQDDEFGWGHNSQFSSQCTRYSSGNYGENDGHGRDLKEDNNDYSSEDTNGARLYNSDSYAVGCNARGQFRYYKFHNSGTCQTQPTNLVHVTEESDLVQLNDRFLSKSCERIYSSSDGDGSNSALSLQYAFWNVGGVNEDNDRDKEDGNALLYYPLDLFKYSRSCSYELDPNTCPDPFRKLRRYARRHSRATGAVIRKPGDTGRGIISTIFAVVGAVLVAASFFVDKMTNRNSSNPLSPSNTNLDEPPPKQDDPDGVWWNSIFKKKKTRFGMILKARSVLFRRGGELVCVDTSTFGPMDADDTLDLDNPVPPAATESTEDDLPLDVASDDLEDVPVTVADYLQNRKAKLYSKDEGTVVSEASSEPSVAGPPSVRSGPRSGRPPRNPRPTTPTRGRVAAQQPRSPRSPESFATAESFGTHRRRSTGKGMFSGFFGGSDSSQRRPSIDSSAGEEIILPPSGRLSPRSLLPNPADAVDSGAPPEKGMFSGWFSNAGQPPVEATSGGGTADGLPPSGRMSRQSSIKSATQVASTVESKSILKSSSNLSNVRKSGVQFSPSGAEIEANDFTIMSAASTMSAGTTPTTDDVAPPMMPEIPDEAAIANPVPMQRSTTNSSDASVTRLVSGPPAMRRKRARQQSNKRGGLLGLW